MSKIDLSKAKIGDKFQTRDGQIFEYHGEDLDHRDDKYELIDGQGTIRHFYQYGEYLYGENNKLDLMEQVIDKPLDSDAIEEEKQELERRQEVLKFADMLFFDQKDTRVALFRYDEAIKVAENIVNIRDKYLKEGKL